MNKTGHHFYKHPWNGARWTYAPYHRYEDFVRDIEVYTNTQHYHVLEAPSSVINECCSDISGFWIDYPDGIK